MSMKLKIKSIERYCRSVSWSGAYNSCLRSVSVDLIDDGKSFEAGDCVELYADGNRLFLGMVVTRQRKSNESIITVYAEDRGIYLKKNTTSLSFTKASPKAIVQKIASQFDIPLGSIANPSYSVTRNFYGVDLYNIIMTAYTLAADGKRFYYPYFNGNGKLCITELVDTKTAQSLYYKSLQYTESIKDMVNVVCVYDSDNKLVATYQNADDLKKYGRFSAYFRKSQTGDTEKEAKAKLQELQQTIKVTGAIGKTSYITGTPLVIRSPLAEVYGLFWIKSDTHNWTGDEYTVNLELSFERIMDEITAGSTPTTSTTTSSTTSTTTTASTASTTTDSSDVAAKIAAWEAKYKLD